MIVVPLLLTLHLAFCPATEQSPAVGEARRLRDSRAFAQAVKVLEGHLHDNPGDLEAVRLRAQLLYWLKDYARARAAYAAALAEHPGEEGLRVDYARMLVETGDRRGARLLLAESHRQSVTSAEADALLGTILYWNGDLTAAKKLFIDALRKDPSHQTAARQLMEIQTLSAPWLRLIPSVWHDDQPLNHAGAALEVGWFATPLLSIAFRSEPVRYAAEGSRTFWTNEAELSHFAPGTGIETHLAAGVFRRPGGTDSLQWVGRGEAALRARGGVTVRGRVQRSPYLFTLASLDTPVTSATFAGLVQWTHRRGWLGEAALQHQRFPDGNQARSVYAWVLAPVLERKRTRLQAGYSLSTADADEDRFVLARPEQPLTPSDPRFDFSGVYRPYYTPARVVTHAFVGAIEARPAAGPTFHAGGSYGFRAEEDATVFFSSGDGIATLTGRRSFQPWTARASLDIPASRALVVSARGEAGRTAYYRWTAVSVHLHFRFLPPGSRGTQSR